MTRIAIILCTIILSSCSYSHSELQTAPESETGGTGNIKYGHKKIASKRHILTVSVSPGILETEDSMAQRMFIFANKFAATTCSEGHDFIDDPNPERRINELTQRTKVYAFRCT